MMGSPSDEEGRDYHQATSSTYAYETLHQVTLTKPFYIGVFEMTQRQFTLIRGTNPVQYSSDKGDLRPVVDVSYNLLRGAIAGAAWPSHSQVDPDSFLGILRAKTGCLFDLPTEAQWEYACRAGTSTAFNDGQNTSIAKVGYCGSSSLQIVGSRKPNAWGIYDMHGNVAERCVDWWKANLGSAKATDPLGPLDGGNFSWSTSSYKGRVVRGGSANGSDYSSWQYCRSAARSADYCIKVDQGGRYIGFRAVATPVVQ